jgi:hypothetical protein
VNLCRACGEDFASVTLFDAHRVGRHEYTWSPEREDGRRCLSVEEMEEKGWTLNAQGRWFDPVRAERVREHFRNTRQPQTVAAGAPASDEVDS